MRTIETASGAVHEVEMCGAADGYLHIILTESTFAGAVEEFSKPENTRTIADHIQEEITAVHAGYTRLVSVAWIEGQKHRVILKKTE